MKRLILPFVFVIVIGSYIVVRPFLRSTPDIQQTSLALTPGARDEIETALEEAIARNTDAGLAMVVFDIGIDRLQISSEGEWAVLWLAALDKETGEPVGMEPWLALGRLVDGEWEVVLPSDPGFQRLLMEVPTKIFSEDDRRILGDGPTTDCDTSAIGPFSGYKLPWEGGKTLFLTQSIYHTVGWGSNPTFSMIHAFDFSASPSGFFQIWAARSGTVKYVWDSQANNDPNTPGNYIVLEDTSTNPTSYQLYLHLAQGSIPANLRLIGTPVQQGQMIAIADDTGASTNHHLHFQVHTEVNWWGCSVDVRFSDVPINGGRPRLPIEAQTNPEYGAQGQTTYVSGNTKPPSNLNPPGGGVLSPGTGDILTSASVSFSGYAFDFLSGVSQAQFAYNIGNGWTPIGTLQTFSGAPGTVYFNKTINLCSAGIPDGPVTFGIMATNDDGDTMQGGLAKPAILDADCAPPPPACQPDADEVALFENINYGGACFVLGTGEYVQNFEARSLLVGNDVSITLYLSSLLRARSQTFFEDDPNLSDDRSAVELFGSARVQLRSDLPGVPIPAWPASDQVMQAESSFSLVWHDGGGGEAFQARITGPSGTFTSTWSANLVWDPTVVDTGSYSWEVRARNGAGESAWSASGTYSISLDKAVSQPAVITAPLNEDFESGPNGWTGTGLWSLLVDSSVAYNGLNTWWYGAPAGDYYGGDYKTGNPNTGSLTSPPILIPESGYYLRFYSNDETESASIHWDRRRVLISADGGPFNEVYQLSEELQDKWRRSIFIDLSAYSGQTIRVRFVFETLDAQFNVYQGWLIDQVTMDKTAPPACTAANEPDSSPAEATAITLGVELEGKLCPVGDLDYLFFFGTAGDRLQLDINAQSIGSQLDPYAFLLAADGTSVVAENDDEVPAVLIDPLLGFTLQETGIYYIKIRAYDHPAQGGDNFFYTIRIELDSSDPVINSLTTSVPLDDISTLPASVTLTADAMDSGSGVVSVEFFYHSFNWGGDEWISIGLDLDGSNGWSAIWNTGTYPPQTGMALMAVATDKAGNVAVKGLWDLFPLPPALYLPVMTR